MLGIYTFVKKIDITSGSGFIPEIRPDHRIQDPNLPWMSNFDGVLSTGVNYTLNLAYVTYDMLVPSNTYCISTEN